ncbi:MAG: hypothetical protein LIO86_13790, partial [Lachnospiraceae bacterium]|nr:hypothetical protein [Lachnospiraceae bacterium]
IVIPEGFPNYIFRFPVFIWLFISYDNHDSPLIFRSQRLLLQKEKSTNIITEFARCKLMLFPFDINSINRETVLLIVARITYFCFLPRSIPLIVKYIDAKQNCVSGKTCYFMLPCFLFPRFHGTRTIPFRNIPILQSVEYR